MKNWKPVAAVLVVFILGGVCGALVAHRVSRHHFDDMMHGSPQAAAEAIVKRLDRKLDLDASQRAEVTKIITEARTDMATVWKEYQPRIDAVMGSAQDRVRAVLRPDQVEKYNRLIEERKQRRERRQGGH